MNTQNMQPDELQDFLKNCGFEVYPDFPYIVVYLSNRSVFPSEVANALDIEQEDIEMECWDGGNGFNMVAILV